MAERRDRTRPSPAAMTCTSMTTRSALGQVSIRERERGFSACSHISLHSGHPVKIASVSIIKKYVHKYGVQAVLCIVI